MFRFVDKLRIDRLFADQYGHAGALGFIILSGNIQEKVTNGVWPLAVCSVFTSYSSDWKAS